MVELEHTGEFDVTGLVPGRFIALGEVVHFADGRNSRSCSGRQKRSEGNLGEIHLEMDWMVVGGWQCRMRRQ